MRQRLLTVVIAGLCLSAATPAFAQLSQPPSRRPERPYRGLFGGGRADIAQSLTANLSFGGGWDDDLLAESRGLAPGTPGPVSSFAGAFGLAEAGLSYSIDHSRVTASATAATSARYYPSYSNQYTATHTAGGQATYSFSERSTLAASVQYYMRPYNVMSLSPVRFTGETLPEPPLDLGLAAANSEYRTWMSGVDFNQGITRRLSGYASYSRSKTEGESGASNQSWRSFGGGLSFQLAKGLAARFGYAFRDAAIETGDDSEPFDGRTIDAGIDFNRSLSPSRKSKLTFSTGISGIDENDLTHYFFIGSVDFSYEIGRTWSINAGAQRDISFVEQFGQPLRASSFSTSLGGLVNRRVQLNFFGGGSSGWVGLANDAPPFWSTYVGASAHYALTRLLALSADYTYSRYHYDEGADIPRGLFRNSERQSISGSVDLWLPLFQQTRRPDASR